MYIEQSELWRLRRFSLGAGLVLLTWALAGVALSPEPHIAPFGLRLVIARPNLIPLGLALAAAYGAARYFYYALSLGPSPYRVRRELLDKLLGRPRTRGTGPFKKPGIYADRLTDLSASPWTTDRQEMEALATQLRAAFPRFAFARVTTVVKADTSFDNDTGDEYRTFTVDASIPIRSRIGAILLDLDYTAPVWFPLGAIVYWRIAT